MLCIPADRVDWISVERVLIMHRELSMPRLIKTWLAILAISMISTAVVGPEPDSKGYSSEHNSILAALNTYIPSESELLDDRRMSAGILSQPMKAVAVLFLTLSPAGVGSPFSHRYAQLSSKQSIEQRLAMRSMRLSMQAKDGLGGRKAANGDTVIVQYRAMVEDGSVIDSQEEAVFKLGEGRVVPGFEDAVLGMEIGEEVNVSIPPEKAYGRINEDALITVPAEALPKGLEIGMRVMLKGAGGQDIPALFSKVNADGSVVLDANHRFAGKTITFEIELLGFRDLVRGMEISGWQGSSMHVPNAISNSDVIKEMESELPAKWPYSEDDFSRQDESDDLNFYSQPRYVAHIDDAFISTIKNFYALQFSAAPQGDYNILDMCSSWISHYPEDLKAKRVAITGMEESELQRNSQATEYVAKDLNNDPTLPYENDTFDFITNVVSVDYLTKPREIFAEMHRVMKPGGVAIMSFSNRCFPTKAIKMWLEDMNDGPGHCKIIGNYFRFNPENGWRAITALDLSPDPGNSDPVWVVTATKT